MTPTAVPKAALRVSFNSPPVDLSMICGAGWMSMCMSSVKKSGVWALGGGGICW